MDSVFMRRLRAVLVMTVLWSVPWLFIGVAIGANLMRVGAVMVPHRFTGDLPVILGAMGGAIGAISGFGFALLLIFAEPTDSFAELRQWRVAQWGALSAAIVGFSIFEGAAMTFLSAALGLLVAASCVSLARRPTSQGSSLALVPPLGLVHHSRHDASYTRGAELEWRQG